MRMLRYGPARAIKLGFADECVNYYVVVGVSVLHSSNELPRHFIHGRFASVKLALTLKIPDFNAHSKQRYK